MALVRAQFLAGRYGRRGSVWSATHAPASRAHWMTDEPLVVGRLKRPAMTLLCRADAVFDAHFTTDGNTDNTRVDCPRCLAIAARLGQP